MSPLSGYFNAFDLPKLSKRSSTKKGKKKTYFGAKLSTKAQNATVPIEHSSSIYSLPAVADSAIALEEPDDRLTAQTEIPSLQSVMPASFRQKIGPGDIPEETKTALSDSLEEPANGSDPMSSTFNEHVFDADGSGSVETSPVNNSETPKRRKSVSTASSLWNRKAPSILQRTSHSSSASWNTGMRAECKSSYREGHEDHEQAEAERGELNQCIIKLSELFPDIRIEVFRELLARFDGLSRLQICVEQLIRYRDAWVKDRWKNNTTAESDADDVPPSEQGSVPLEKQFRSRNYKEAVRSLIILEFRSLSRNTIDDILTKHNYSYTHSRPTLQDLSKQTWRSAIENLFTSRKKRRSEHGEHPLIYWPRAFKGSSTDTTSSFSLKPSGSHELDEELFKLFLEPIQARAREEQESNDRILAEKVNEDEAKTVGALYECGCCFSNATFEQIATCSTGEHIICQQCIQRTVHEALFGQGWNQSVDDGKLTIRCLSPLHEGSCPGTLQPAIVKKAILSQPAGDELFRKFETRFATSSLIRSRLQLIHCPFCPYAEVDSIYHPPPGGIPYTLRRRNFTICISISLIFSYLCPLLPILLLVACISYRARIYSAFASSCRNLCLKKRTQRFTCRNPACTRSSCMTCYKAWRDPHVCHQTLLASLRSTVEAARTAAIKRTCPQCGTSFVKSSGCNKLTCICGYKMCYLCRAALGSPPRGSRRRTERERSRQQQDSDDFDPENDDVYSDDEQTSEDDDDSQEESEEEDYHEPGGYKHFCQHFRPTPGTPCGECNKCELYADEDEEFVARRAGEKAERLWRIREGLLKANSGYDTPDGKTPYLDGGGRAGFDPESYDELIPGMNGLENLGIQLDNALAGNRGFLWHDDNGSNSIWYFCRRELLDLWRSGPRRYKGPRRLIDFLTRTLTQVQEF